MAGSFILASELYVGVDKKHNKSYDFIQWFIKKEMSDCFGRERHGMERIESASNTKIKWAASLHQRKERKHRGEFVAEGVRLVETAAASDWPLRFCIATETALVNERVQRIVVELESKGCPIYVVSPNIYKKASATESPQGILLVMESVQNTLAELSAKNNSLVIVLDRIQDPGNVGTMIRTADAAGCSGVIATVGTADLFSDKVVRSSMGSLFHLPLVTEADAEEVIAFARERDISFLAAALDPSATPHFSADYRKASAVVFGNEGEGVSSLFLASAEHIYIPMLGRAESLNVATSSAIVLYEALRQRCCFNADSSKQR